MCSVLSKSYWESRHNNQPIVGGSNGRYYGPLFQKAVDNAKAYLRCTALDHLRAWSKKVAAHCQQVFLHLPYHPANPSSKAIQKLSSSRVAIRGSCLRVPAIFLSFRKSSGNALSQNSKLRVVIWQDSAPKISPCRFLILPPPSTLIAIISKSARSWEDFRTLRQWNRSYWRR
jgi:hypothetical protein